MKRCFLYMLVFPNGKQYVGIANNVSRRWHCHKRDAIQRNRNFPVQNAIRKFGADSVLVVTLVCGCRAYIADLEQRAIAAFKSREEGYNVSIGGELSPMMFEESRERMRKTLRQYYADPEARRRNAEAQRIAHRTPEAREMHRQLSLGRTHSTQAREKMSLSRRGRKLSSEEIAKSAASRRGQIRSDESRRKMSAGQKRRVRTAEELARMKVMATQKVFTQQYRAKLSEAAKKRIRAPDFGAKVSAALKKKYAEHPHPCIGRVLSAESRAKISATLRQRALTKRAASA